MEVQLQELIDQIKRNGVDAAEEEASAILTAANAEAQRIRDEARIEAEEMLRRTREECDRTRRVSEEAIRQAGRNLLLSFRSSVAKELTAVAGEQVSAVFSAEAFASLLIRVVEAWAAKEDAEDLSLLLCAEDLAALEGQLLAALKERMLGGVTLQPDDRMSGGFRIACEGGSVYYDYSAEAVTQMLASYLNPRVTALLKEAAAP